MKRKLHNFNTMDFLFFLIAIFPLVYPLFCMFCSALATESTSVVDFSTDYYTIASTWASEINVLGLSEFNSWLMTNIVHFSDPKIELLLNCAEWYLFVYLLRMAFDFLMVIPNIVHNFVHKLGGSSSD